MPLGIFGIADDTVNLVVNLLVLFLIVVWFALIAWTYFDAKRRIEDPVLVMCATGASLFPYVGTIVYSILRPPEFLEERHERELEIRASELRVRQLEEQSCPNCDYPIERAYLRCPRCRARIKHPCEACREPVDPRWAVCPYCETALRAPQPERRPATRPRRQPARPKPEAEPVRQGAASGERPARKAASSGGQRARSDKRPTQERPTRAPSRGASSVGQRQGGGDSPRGSGKPRPKRSEGGDKPRTAPSG
jgi:hypothetical protein